MKITYPINEGSPVVRDRAEILAEHDKATHIAFNRLQYYMDDLILWRHLFTTDNGFGADTNVYGHAVIWRKLNAAINDLEGRKRWSPKLTEQYFELQQEVARERGHSHTDHFFDLTVTGNDPRLAPAPMVLSISLRHLPHVEGNAAAFAEQLIEGLGWTEEELTWLDWNGGTVRMTNFAGQNMIEDIEEQTRLFIEERYGNYEQLAGHDISSGCGWGELPENADLVQFQAYLDRETLEVYWRKGLRLREWESPVSSGIFDSLDTIRKEIEPKGYRVMSMGKGGLLVGDWKHEEADYDKAYADFGDLAHLLRGVGLLVKTPYPLTDLSMKQRQQDGAGKSLAP